MVEVGFPKYAEYIYLTTLAGIYQVIQTVLIYVSIIIVLINGIMI